ncbi:hypothetical protein NIES4101_75030 [Calothrix sp. NIES-4101]|nr:hypothetical protein NIES4101_75030 [Calothrix sp. NIES-4101]
MAVIRLILLFTILAGLTLLLVQNFSPALSLTFLGMRSQPLPLAIWILLSVVAGSITSLLVSSLYELADSLGTSSKQARSTAKVSSSSSRAATNPSSKPKSESSSDAEDDWNLEASEDWDFEQQTNANTRFQEEVRDRKVSDSRRNSQSDYAESDDERGYRQQQAESARKSASSYSYSYREPKNSGVGKTESVYDADYRVIVPPYKPPSPEASQPTAPADSTSSTSKINDISDDDDWSFFDESDGDLRDEPRDSR